MDENGEFWWIAIGAIIGAAVNVGIHMDNINSAGDFFGYLGIGAVAGALGAVTDGAISGVVGGLSGVAGGAIIGAGSGAVSYFKGQNVWTGADVAAGRSQFSFDNTPVAGAVRTPRVTVEPDAMPNSAKVSKPTAVAAEASDISLETTSSVKDIADRLKSGLQVPKPNQEFQVQLIEGDFKIDFRVETHAGLDRVFQDMNLHPNDYVRHANIQFYKMVEGQWKPVRVPGTKDKDFHIFLNLVNKYIE